MDEVSEERSGEVQVPNSMQLDHASRYTVRLFLNRTTAALILVIPCSGAATVVRSYARISATKSWKTIYVGLFNCDVSDYFDTVATPTVRDFFLLNVGGTWPATIWHSLKLLVLMLEQGNRNWP